MVPSLCIFNMVLLFQNVQCSICNQLHDVVLQIRLLQSRHAVPPELDNVLQDLKAKMSDDGNLCFLSQPQATGDTDRISDVHSFATGRGRSDFSDTTPSKKKGYPANLNPEHGKDLQFST